MEPRPPLAGELRADVAIVGGGYAGMWTALAIRRRDPEARVVLLEAGVCGDGPSGRNAGFVNGYWQHLDRLCESHGDAAAVEVCDLADASIDAVGEFAREHDPEIAYLKAGQVKVSASPAQDGSWLPALRACAEHGRADKLVALDADAVRERCASPVFRGGALIEAATVQPARLARALRRAVLDSGTLVGERTRARAVRARPGGGVLVETDGGAWISTAKAVVAINAAAAGFAPLRPRLAVTSTHMIITEPVPDLLERIGWTGGECVSTARRQLHYFRTTADGRIAFGWGGGRLAYGARLGRRVEIDRRIVDRLRADILRIFPGLSGRRIDAAWGGPVDVSPTHVPCFGTVAGSPIHYVCGFTGNGVGPAHMAGETLASLALESRDRHSGSALVEADHARVPGEPVRYLGGSIVRAALVRQGDLEDRNRPVDALTRIVIEAPRRLGIHVGR